MSLSDNEIIIGVNYCANIDDYEKCDCCPIKDECDSATENGEFIKAIADLINHQKAEIERLEEQVNLWQEEASSVGCANEWLRAHLKNAEAEAIKECIEKTQEFLSTKCRGVVEDKPNLDEILYGYRVEDVDEFFDNLVKKMVGDTA